MARDYVTLGPTPAGEPCAQLGEDGYYERAMEESRRYIDLIRKKFGPEPQGARLCVKSFNHDFGTYHEVCCSFDTENEAAMEYALRCEGESPLTWEG